MLNNDAPKQFRRIRIENDGNTPWPSTRVTDADTGEELDSVLHLRIIDIDRDGARAILWSLAPAIDITADAEVIDVCPCCGSQQPSGTEDAAYRLQTTINDVDIDVSMGKLKRLQDLQRAVRETIEPAEALFAFCGWLASRIEASGPFAAHLDASILAELVGMFNDAQGWEIDDAHYDKVIKRLKANYPD
jgi:hypothetical protein